MLICIPHWSRAAEPQAHVTTTNRIGLPRSQLELPLPPPGAASACACYAVGW